MRLELVQSQSDLEAYEATIDPQAPQAIQTRMLQTLHGAISQLQNALLQNQNDIESKLNKVKILEEDMNELLNPLDTDIYIYDNLEICDVCHFIIENCECLNDEDDNESNGTGYN